MNDFFVHVSRICFVLAQLLLMCVADNDRRSAFPVCSLDNGQNAVYWWVPENHAPGTKINSLPIQGLSSGTKPEIALRLVEGNEWFRINVPSKQLILNKALDRESGKVRLDAVVECKSLLPKDTFKVNITVQVKVQDVNDNHPQFEQSDYYVNVSEELPVGTVVFRGLHAMDIDQEGPNSEVHYSIVHDGPLSELFAIPNSWEGTVVVGQRIDYETVKALKLTIAAKDSGSPPLQSFATLHATVLDIDDLNPTFQHDFYSAIVFEDMKPGSVVDFAPSSPKAADGDTLNATVLYSISGEGSENFAISAITGAVKLKRVSAGSTYIFNIVGTQKDRSERRSSAVLRISVAGDEKSMPKLTLNNYTLELPESTPNGTVLLSLDIFGFPNRSVHWSIMDESKLPQFSIDPQRRLLLKSPLDYEEVTRHDIALVAMHKEKQTKIGVTILVLNDNDNSPVFQKQSYHFTCKPQASGSSIGYIKATDADADSRVSYELLTGTEVFKIDSNTGELQTVNSNKLLLTNASYELLILATDTGKPPRQGYTVATVDVTNSSVSVISYASLEKTQTASFLVLIISLACIAATLLAVTLFLSIYVFSLRRRQPKVQQISPSQSIARKPTNSMHSTMSYDAKAGQSSVLQVRFADPGAKATLATEEDLHYSCTDTDRSSRGSQSPLQRLLENVSSFNRPPPLDAATLSRASRASIPARSAMGYSNTLGRRTSAALYNSPPDIVPGAPAYGQFIKKSNSNSETTLNKQPLTVYF